MKTLNRMKNTFIIILLILTQSCSTENSVLLSNDPIIKEHFNKKEIQELNKILEFFENEVTFTSSSHNINDIYELFFLNLQLDENKPIISFDKQKTFFENLNPKLLNEMWYCELEYVPYLNDTTELIRYPWKGKYFEFLLAASEKDKGIKNYFDDYTSVESMSPTVLAYSMKYYNENNVSYDLTIERNRLIIAVNYLIYNEQLRLEEIQRNKNSSIIK